MTEINATVRIVIRHENGERFEYTRKLRSKDLTDNRGFWAQSAKKLTDDATEIVTAAIRHEHGGPHAAPR